MPIIITGVCLFLLLASALVTSYVCYRLAFKRRRLPSDPHARIKCPEGVDEGEIHGMIDKLLAEECEEVKITSEDGLCLAGRLYMRREGAPFKIMCHGYTSSPFRDMSGGSLESLARGYNLLLISQRAHGDSEGRCMTFGAREKRDLVLWTEYLVKRTEDRSDIILTGLSMGAATVLLASELALPREVRCIVADCPYSSAEDILKLKIKHRGLPVFPFYPLMRLGARLFGGFSLKECDVEGAVKRSRLPIFLIHGEADSFVPCDMSRKIYAASTSECELVTVEGATHGMCFMTDRDTYIRRVESFIARHTQKNPEESNDE